MVNDLTSPVERGSIIDVSQQGVILSCASPLTGSGSGEGACVRWVALIDHSIPDFVVAWEVMVARTNGKFDDVFRHVERYSMIAFSV